MLSCVPTLKSKMLTGMLDNRAVLEVLLLIDKPVNAKLTYRILNLGKCIFY